MQASKPIPRQRGDDPVRSSQSIQNPSAFVLPVQNAKHSQNDEQSRNSPPDTNANKTIVIQEPVSVSGWEKGYVILTGLLVIVGAIGVRYAVRSLGAVERQAKANEGQLTEIQKSVEAAKRSADAAFLNAQAVINTERPWVVIFVECDKSGAFAVKAGNIGRTPARIISYSLDYTFSDDPGKLPPISRYRQGTAPIPDILVPSPDNQGHTLQLLSMRDCAQHLAERPAGNVGLVVYCKVLYTLPWNADNIPIPTAY